MNIVIIVFIEHYGHYSFDLSGSGNKSRISSNFSRNEFESILDLLNKL